MLYKILLSKSLQWVLVHARSAVAGSRLGLSAMSAVRTSLPFQRKHPNTRQRQSPFASFTIPSMDANMESAAPLCISDRCVVMLKTVLAGISATLAELIVKLLSFDEKTIFLCIYYVFNFAFAFSILLFYILSSTPCTLFISLGGYKIG